VKALIAAVLSLFLLVACSGQAETYSTTAELTGALQDEGVSCADLTQDSAAELVTERASCSVSGTDVDIYLFDDETDRERWLEIGAGLGEVVLGPNWAIATTDEDLSREIADALGGTIR